MAHDGQGPLAQCTPCNSGDLKSETVDRFTERNCLKVSLIQLDIEGGEKDALAGARDTLKRDLPTVFFEIHFHFYSFSEPLATIPRVAQLLKLGYKLFAIRDYWGVISQPISPIELIPLDKAKVDGPDHGINVLAIPEKKDRLPFDYQEVTFKSPKLIPQKKRII